MLVPNLIWLMMIDEPFCSEKSVLYSESRSNKNKDTKLIQVTETPRRHLSPEIAKLSGQIVDKFNPTIFTRESHLRKTDPGYGTPQVN